jgi:hypothetical protein
MSARPGAMMQATPTSRGTEGEDARGVATPSGRALSGSTTGLRLTLTIQQRRSPKGEKS